MKDRKPDEAKITGFFDEGTEMKGDLKFRGSFRIDGLFKGTVQSDSVLIIGDKGKVEADVFVAYLVVNGEFRGNIKAAERVEIHGRGRVFGTIVTPTLVVEEGAFLQANCQTSEPVAEPAAETA